VPAGDELMDGFEGLRALGAALGCNDVDEADETGRTDERERPPVTTGPYALQRLKAKSMVKPLATVPICC